MRNESSQSAGVIDASTHRESTSDSATRGHSHVPVHYQPKTQKGIVIFAGVLVVALLAAFAVVQFRHHGAHADLANETARAAGAPVAVDAIRVGRSGSHSILALPGEARSFYETTLFARTNGY